MQMPDTDRIVQIVKLRPRLLNLRLNYREGQLLLMLVLHVLRHSLSDRAANVLV